MGSSPFIDSEFFRWIILPLLIFLARICDVSVGTLRILFLSRGNRYRAPVLGFFEVLIWLLAIRVIFLNLTNIIYYLAYAAGFACGTFVGMMIEERLAIGFQVIRVITKKSGEDLIDALIKCGFGVTSLPAKGATGDVHVIFTIIHRKDIRRVIEMIKTFNPKAFYSLADIRSVQQGVFPDAPIHRARKM